MRTLETKGNLARVLDALPKQRFTRQEAFDRLVPTFDKLRVSNAITWAVKNRRLISVERGVYEWSNDDGQLSRADMVKSLQAATLAAIVAERRGMPSIAEIHREKAEELRCKLAAQEVVV